MTDAYDAAIEALKKEIADRMRTVNDLCRLDGREPLYADAEGAASTSGKIRPDQWYRAGISTAAREFLEMRHASRLGPASVDDIYAALAAGSFQFETRDSSSAKAALKQSLTKNSAIFHRLPNGSYGLAVWYPGIKDDSDEVEAKTAKKKKMQRRKALEAEKKSEVPVAQNRDAEGSETLVDVVRRAIAAMPETFTKPDVFNWIGNNSNLKMQKESVFVTVTKLREEMGFVTHVESKGREPSVYRKIGSGKASVADNQTPRRQAPKLVIAS